MRGPNQHTESGTEERQKAAGIWCHLAAELTYFEIFLSWDILLRKIFLGLIMYMSFIENLIFLKSFQYISFRLAMTTICIYTVGD